MPVYKDESKKKNKWWYEFEAGKKPNGKRNVIRKKGFFTEKEAKAAMVKAESEYYEGTYVDPSKTKFGVYLLDQWLPIKSLAGSTKEMYDSYIRNHVLGSLIAETPLANLTIIMIQDYIQMLKEKKIVIGKKKPKESSLSPNTIKKIYSIINTSLNDAVTMKKLKENPSKKIINKPANQKTKSTVWNQAQIRKFVEETEGKSRYSLAFRFTLMTGLRQAEVLGLRWKDVDFEKSVIRVQQTITHDGKTLKDGAKTDSSVRPVKLDVKTMNTLIKHYNMQQLERKQIETKVAEKKAAGKSFYNGRQYRDHDLVFCTVFGTPCTPRNLSRAYNSLLKEIDVPKITFHELRHTQATLLLTKNVHPKVVSERLGHSSVKITLDTYSHMLPEMQEVAAECLADVL
ncbi:Site-specific recombinase XerD [Paenibacillus sophorae]|uniref:Site-specific integrase n=1 Tax=Paenibacillus sophorae TaxID=1333845 RepID=A0A1H8JHX6_9BACL|nr:site-specific integrase [Paenibacillus sophorae]QWU13369.1 site-specific integrase [Paenibacillus sophorae]SEN80359.1 Site-specific recombinase XerD [Paenibacillus sophorae]